VPDLPSLCRLGYPLMTGAKAGTKESVRLTEIERRQVTVLILRTSPGSQVLSTNRMSKSAGLHDIHLDALDESSPRMGAL